MDLREFIKTTLIQITDGVLEAQKAVAEKGTNINPVNFGFQKDGQWHNYFDSAMPQEIHFDVALTESDSAGAEGGIGVFLGGVGIGSKAKTGTQSSSQTRIQFSVPLILPPGKRERE